MNEKRIFHFDPTSLKMEEVEEFLKKIVNKIKQEKNLEEPELFIPINNDQTL